MNWLPPIGFVEFAESDPDRPAIFGPGSALRTAGEVLANLGRIRRWVASTCEGGARRVALVSDNDSSVIEIYLACTTGGLSLLIVSADDSPYEISAQIKDFAPDLTIINADASRAEALADVLEHADNPGRVVNLSGVGSGQSRLDRAVESFSDEQMNTVPGDLYVTTSGTTGQSKVVRFSMDDVVMGTSIDNLPVPAEYQVFEGPHLTWGQMHGGPVHLMSTIIVLNLGRPIVLSNDPSPESILRSIEQYSVTSVVLMPWNMQQLLALPDDVRERHDVSSLRAVFHGGAPCPIWLKTRMLDWLGPVLLETYATIETGPVTIVSSADWTRHPGSVGRVVDGAQIKVLDSEGGECSAGEIGRVIVRTKNHESWHDPADLGCLDEEGWLTLAGRQADVITRGTRNVYPDEIEQALSGCPGVAELSVVGWSNDDVQDTIFVLVARNGLADDQEIIDEVRRRSMEGLQRLKWPGWLLFVERLPRGRDGKVLRRILREMIAGGYQDDVQRIELFAGSATASVAPAP